MKKIIYLMAVLFAAYQGHLYAQTIFPTGVTIYDKTKAYNCYVFFGGADGKSYLVDMNGNVVNKWEYNGSPSEYLDPTLTGNRKGDIIIQYEKIKDEGTSLAPGRPDAFCTKTIAQLDWGGKVIWKWGESAPTGAARQHHDQERLPNGHTLILANQRVTIPGFTRERSLDDVVYEVNTNGEIIWTWRAAEHLTEFGFTDEQLKLVKGTDKEDYLHINTMTSLGANRWYDRGDERFNPNNILVGSREANFLVIIDKKTGKVVWNLGPNFEVSKEKGDILPRPVDRMVGQHDAHIIANGLPGAGNILVFDNEGQAGYPPVVLPAIGGSRVLEIDPVTKKIVWLYSAQKSNTPSWNFNSFFISSARRLPNGNTLIDEGMKGRVFQVTPDGKIVWEFVNPFFTDGNTKNSYFGKTNFIYRAQPVPYDWVPNGTPRSEKEVNTPDVSQFRITNK